MAFIAKRLANRAWQIALGKSRLEAKVYMRFSGNCVIGI